MLASKLSSSVGTNSASANYIEDVFSTYLYTGNGSTQTITNGIDLAGKGGLVWTKWRSNVYGAIANGFWDTARGVKKELVCPSTAGQYTYSTDGVTTFNSDGFAALATTQTFDAIAPDPSSLYVSWTFRKQPKFFDVVTYTGNGVDRDISHDLASVPGCIIIKRTDSTGDWIVYHRGLSNSGLNYSIKLNTTAAQINQGGLVATSTTFTLYNAATVNTNGATYVAYIFAHDAGGFGLTGTDNVISCGSFTPDGTGNATIDLGWEPQWLLRKTYNNVGDWEIRDCMRDFSMSSSALLYPNYSLAETTGAAATFIPTATGFKYVNGGTQPMIYIAIRRGPMKVPTSGTSVFAPVANTVSGNNQSVSTGFPVDLVISKLRTLAIADSVFDRLRGSSATSGALLVTSSTGAEGALTTNGMGLDNNTGYVDNFDYWNTGGSYTYGNWAFRRAPSFFDEVCYTGTGSATTFNHNLGVAPEMMIVKVRDTTNNWVVYHKDIGATNYLYLNTTSASAAFAGFWNNTAPTSSVFTVGNNAAVNGSLGPYKYVNYLFATCAGVSKVGSYTGTGATQTISCGFTGGARFVLIKRTDSTGNWGVLDTARGMVSGTDPYLNLNTTAAEVNANNVYTTTGGFQLVSSDANFNANGGTYIFLAIA